MRIERSSVFGKKSFPGEHDHLDRCFQTFGDRPTDRPTDGARPTDRKPLGLFLNWPLTNFGAIEKKVESTARRVRRVVHAMYVKNALDFQAKCYLR